MLKLLPHVSPWAGIQPSFDAHNRLGKEKGFLSINKKGKGKEGKKKKESFEIPEQNILIRLINKSVQKRIKIFHETAKFTQLWIWGVDAEGSLESGAETGNDTNSCRRRGVILFTWDRISSTAPDTGIHQEIHHGRTVSDWYFRSRGTEFLRLPQPRVWGKVMRAICEQSRSWLSGRGTLSHQTMKMHSFQWGFFFSCSCFV